MTASIISSSEVSRVESKSSWTSTPAIVLYAVVGLVAILFIASCSGYNGLVSSKNNYEESWANVQAQYQRRLDTIPNMVATAKFSSDFQVQLQKEVAQARSNIDQAAANKDKDLGKLQGTADAAIQGLTIRVQQEAVPEAKVDQLTQLNANIESIERTIAHERDAFNRRCKEYRNKVQRFPTNIVANFAGYSSNSCKPYEAQGAAQNAPKVDFGTGK